MSNIGVQLFTLRDVQRSIPDILQLVADTGADGVEFVEWEHELTGENTDAIRDSLTETGLSSAGALLDLCLLEENLSSLLAAYKPLNCRTYTVGYMPAEHFQTPEAVESLAFHLNEVSDLLTERDLTLAYHHHDHEFVEFADGSWAFDRLLESTSQSVSFELDIAWAAVAGRDPTEMITSYADRVSHVHVKDADADDGTIVELGHGDVDIEGCVDAGLAADVEWFVYEYDHPEDPVSSLHHGVETIRSLIE